MNYLLFTLEYFPFHGGIADYYHNLVKNYPEHISVLDNQDNNLLNLHLPVFKFMPGMIKLIKKIRAEKINYIFVGHIIPLGIPTWLLSWIFNFKYAVFLHGYDLFIALEQPRYTWLVEKILARADKIICANSFVAKRVKEIIDQKQLGKVKIVNPGISGRLPYNEKAIQQLREQYNLSTITLFSLGRLVERKGFDKVIEALPLVIKKVPNLYYYLAGDGPDKEYLENKIKELAPKVRKKIKFLGSLNEKDKWLWLDVADIFIMPARQIGSDVEGFGIVYLEANLAGKPVIAGRSGGVPDAVIDDKTGLLVDPENINEIAEAIIRLSKYQGLRQRLGDYGRQRALQDFNWKKQAQKVYNIVNNK